MPSAEGRLTREHGRILLDVAARSIEHGVRVGGALPVDPADCDPVLRRVRASFVTLHLAGELRGCVGSLEAKQPLVVDVAESAFKAALRDPRFPPLEEPELAGLDVHLSVLSPLEPVDVGSERELLDVLRPGIDGLLIREGTRDATFLPSVWGGLPEPARFVRELKRKAGLPDDHWSPGIRVSRYTVESFLEEAHSTREGS